MDYKDNEITMTLDDYLNLRDKAVEYDRLLNVLFSNCRLELGPTGEIDFNSYDLNLYLRSTVPGRYSDKLKELRELRDKQ